MKHSNRKIITLSVVLMLIIGSLVPILSGCASTIEIDTSGMYLVVYDGNGGFLGNKSSTVRKLFCQPGSKIPDYPVEYSDNQYTVSSLGRAMREGYNLMGWYTADAATYKESENGEYVYLSADDGNGIFEISPSGEYVRKYEKADNGDYIFVHIEESVSADENAEAEPDKYVFIDSVVEPEDEAEPVDDGETEPADDGEVPADTENGEETPDAEEAEDAENGDSEEKADENVIVLSVESGFYICNGDETINEIDDENLREAYRKAYETKTYTLSQIEGIAGWQKYDELPAAFAEVFAKLDRYDYAFAKATEEDEGLDRYAIESGYASLNSIFIEDAKGEYIFVSPNYVKYDENDEIHSTSQRYTMSDRYVFTPEGELENPSMLTRYDATMDYWDFANDTVTEDKCEWDGEKYTGREQLCDVTYVMRHCPEYGIMDGYCILSICLRKLYPTVKRHGHWIVSKNYQNSGRQRANSVVCFQICQCKRHFLYVWDWENADERCRHCGAIMDEPMDVRE